MEKHLIGPTIVIIINIFTAINYIGLDSKMVVYWIAAAVLTASVTY
jgi:hypothetical protein